jgi:hypothetical protein
MSRILVGIAVLMFALVGLELEPHQLDDFDLLGVGLACWAASAWPAK